MAGARTCAPVLENLWRPVIRRDQDVWKRFVVTQEHVEARPQTLDEISFKQQRFGLGTGYDEFERARGRDHALDASVEAGRPCVSANSVAHVFRFADI